MEGMIRCPGCGNTVPVDVEYCLYCGAQLAPQAGRPPAAEQAGGRRRRDKKIPVREEVPVREEIPAGEAKEPSASEKNTAEEPERPGTPGTGEAGEENVSASAAEAIQGEWNTEDVPPHGERGGEPDPDGYGGYASPEGEDDAGELPEEGFYGDAPGNGTDPDPGEGELPEYGSASVGDDGDGEGAGNGILGNLRKKGLKGKDGDAVSPDEIDPDTGFRLRGSFEGDLPNARGHLCIVSVRARGYHSVVEEKGGTYGGILISSVAQPLGTVFGKRHCYRLSEDMFAVIAQMDAEKAAAKVAQMRKALAAREMSCGVQLDIRADIGIGEQREGGSAQDAWEAATEDMERDREAQDQVYAPNHDRYYDDVEAEYDEAKRELDRDAVKNTIKVIAAVAVFLIVYYLVFGR